MERSQSQPDRRALWLLVYVWAAAALLSLGALTDFYTSTKLTTRIGPVKVPATVAGLVWASVIDGLPMYGLWIFRKRARFALLLILLGSGESFGFQAAHAHKLGPAALTAAAVPPLGWLLAFIAYHFIHSERTEEDSQVSATPASQSETTSIRIVEDPERTAMPSVYDFDSEVTTEWDELNADGNFTRSQETRSLFSVPLPPKGPIMAARGNGKRSASVRDAVAAHLRNHPNATNDEMAEAFGCTIRTVQIGRKLAEERNHADSS